MKIKIDFNTLPELFNAKVKNSEDVKDLSNIKFVISYFERNKKIDALKKVVKILNQYAVLESYSNGNVVDLTKLPEDEREKIIDCKHRIKDMDSYINEKFLQENINENNL